MLYISQDSCENHLLSLFIFIRVTKSINNNVLRYIDVLNYIFISYFYLYKSVQVIEKYTLLSYVRRVLHFWVKNLTS